MLGCWNGLDVSVSLFLNLNFEVEVKVQTSQKFDLSLERLKVPYDE